MIELIAQAVSALVVVGVQIVSCAWLAWLQVRVYPPKL